MNEPNKKCKCGEPFLANCLLKHVFHYKSQCKEKYTTEELTQLKSESYIRRLANNRRYKNKDKWESSSDESNNNNIPPWEKDQKCKKCKKIFKQNVFLRHVKAKKCSGAYTEEDIKLLKLDSNYKKKLRDMNYKKVNNKMIKKKNAEYYKRKTKPKRILEKMRKKQQQKEEFYKQMEEGIKKKKINSKAKARDKNILNKKLLNNEMTEIIPLRQKGADETSLQRLSDYQEEISSTFAKIEIEIQQAEQKTKDMNDNDQISECFAAIKIDEKWQKLQRQWRRDLYATARRYKYKVPCLNCKLSIEMKKKYKMPECVMNSKCIAENKLK